jgi:hypothetical protein
LEKQKHFDEMQNATMQEMFQVDATRTAKFNLKWNDFYRLFKEYNQPRNY